MAPGDLKRARSALPLRSSTSGLGEIARLPNRPGLAAVGTGRKPGILRSVGVSVAFGERSSLALALVLDQRGSRPNCSRFLSSRYRRLSLVSATATRQDRASGSWPANGTRKLLIAPAWRMLVGYSATGCA